MAIEFGDISAYQAGADLAAYLRGEHDRILFKATEGLKYQNPQFIPWWQWASRIGLGRGAYHYARPSQSSGASEAEHFVAVVRQAGGLGPRDWMVLDVEDPDGTERAAQHAADFCRRMVQLGYPKVVIYTYTPYAVAARLTPDLLPESCRWLHVANYGGSLDVTVPIPPGWVRSQVVARQFTSTASQPGIPGQSDRSRVLVEWLPEGDDDMPTAAEIVDELERRVYAGMKRAETPKLGLATLNPWEILGRTYFKAGWLQDPGVTGVNQRLDALATETSRIGTYLGADGAVVAWMQQIGSELAAIRTDLAQRAGNGADLGPVLDRLDHLTFAVVAPVTSQTA